MTMKRRERRRRQQLEIARVQILDAYERISKQQDELREAESLRKAFVASINATGAFVERIMIAHRREKAAGA